MILEKLQILQKLDRIEERLNDQQAQLNKQNEMIHQLFQLFFLAHPEGSEQLKLSSAYMISLFKEILEAGLINEKEVEDVKLTLKYCREQIEKREADNAKRDFDNVLEADILA